MEIIQMPAMWHAKVSGGRPAGEAEGILRVPGSLDESGIGFPETEAQAWHPDAKIEKKAGEGITTRLTRVVTFEGCAHLETSLLWNKPEGCRVFFEVERARCLRVRVNGMEAAPFEPFSLSAPQVFEVTDAVRGLDRFEVDSDNSYPGLPHDDIVFSSGATDETQTNWNGLLGYARLRLENPVFISGVRVYPGEAGARVEVEVCSPGPYDGHVRLFSEAFEGEGDLPVSLEGGRAAFSLVMPYRADVRRWDLGEGTLYSVTASGDGLDSVTVSFGVRRFAAENGMFTLNGRTVFLRSEANCAVFPETGYPPMETDKWMEILSTYRAYGVNCMRFHSHVPPEAAFTAADRLGMLMQPELPCWNPRHAFEDDGAYAFYAGEMKAVLRFLANHPSFVMLTFGNELHAGALGHERMSGMLRVCRETDPTRLYANASNPHYGALGCDADSDFYTSQSFDSMPLRACFAGMGGHTNECYPSTDWDYRESMERLRETYAGPVMAFEVGQYELLPDFSEIPDFRGITRAGNLEAVRRQAAEKGMLEDWEERFRATAAISRMAYRAEVEANLRTGLLAGISLLGLQDFPGQGTAIVGMLNSHLRPKPSPDTQPEAFEAFFRDVLPLARLPRYTWEEGETLRFGITLANYGKAPVRGPVTWELLEDGEAVLGGEAGEMDAPCGGLTPAGSVEAVLPACGRSRRLTLRLSAAGHENTYPLWVYVKVKPVCPDGVLYAEKPDGRVREALERGGRVLLMARGLSDECSVRAQFTTDFWSVGTFPQQPGTMGQLIESTHPLFASFPTENHTDWQWYPMASAPAMVLPGGLQVHSLVTEMDCYARMRRMSQLFVCRCLGGSLMVCSMEVGQEHPEERALLEAMYRYMAEADFAREPEADFDAIRGLFEGEA